MIAVWFGLWFSAALLLLRPWRHPARPLVPDAAGSPTVSAKVPVRDIGLVALGAAAIVQPVLAALAAVAFVVRRRWHRTASVAAGQRAELRVLPEVIDLLMLGVGAGQTMRRALHSAAPFLPSPFAEVASATRRRVDAGVSFTAALDDAAASLDPVSAPLITLMSGADHGGPMLPALTRLGDEARRLRRTAAQERARKLPVALLMPLVVCVLPAFGLLAVVPLVLSSLRSLNV